MTAKNIAASVRARLHNQAKESERAASGSIHPQGNTMYVQLVAQGGLFSPGAAEKNQEFVFLSKNEPGDTGVFGRDRGKPLPYGSGTLECLLEDDSLAPITPEFIVELRSLGATEIFVTVNIEHGEQCNFDLSTTLLADFAALGTTVGFSCYERDSASET